MHYVFIKGDSIFPVLGFSRARLCDVTDVLFADS
jgi:hypothetical protein